MRWLGTHSSGTLDEWVTHLLLITLEAKSTPSHPDKSVMWQGHQKVTTQARCTRAYDHKPKATERKEI